MDRMARAAGVLVAARTAAAPPVRNKVSSGHIRGTGKRFTRELPDLLKLPRVKRMAGA
jgi:hypothetical protein